MTPLALVAVEEEVLSRDDDHVTAALTAVIQQPGEPFGGKPLMAHEGEVLAAFLGQRPFDEDKLGSMVDFLAQVDPLVDGGWDEARLETYIQAAIDYLEHPSWLMGAFAEVDRIQHEVSRETGVRLFRTPLLKAAVAFYITEFPPEEVEPHHAAG